jgi:hypothetical protein
MQKLHEFLFKHGWEMTGDLRARFQCIEYTYRETDHFAPENEWQNAIEEFIYGDDQ